jgi:23S rRNA U2552 (ribose-2'-O)-methylase RlmE/FtsJ
MEELAEKTILLKERSKTIRKDLPAEVKALLSDYYNKISGIDFLDLIDDYDIQANILKTMLNTEGM